VPASAANLSTLFDGDVRRFYTFGVIPSHPVVPSPLSIDQLLTLRRMRGLVAIFDFDGTLAEIEPTPQAVRAQPHTAVWLEALSRRADTTVAVVSGRPVAQLERLIDVPDVWLVGLHGWEERPPGRDAVRWWSEAEMALARRQTAELQVRLGRSEGETLEDKGPLVAVHTRNARTERRRRVEEIVRAARLPELEVVAGRRVFEFRPAQGRTKGTAVQTIAATRRDAAVLYVGDDTTDEDAFAVLGADDFAVIVDDATARVERPGGSHTRATYSLRNTTAVGRVLAALVADTPQVSPK
jgi:trehalose 6-phosphate phosphatase